MAWWITMVTVLLVALLLAGGGGGRTARAEVITYPWMRGLGQDRGAALTDEPIMLLAVWTWTRDRECRPGFAIGAIMKFQHKDNPTQIPISGPIALFLISKELQLDAPTPCRARARWPRRRCRSRAAA